MGKITFTDYPFQINWNCVDQLISVSEDIRKYVTENFRVNKKITIVIPNGVDMEKWNFIQRSHGFPDIYCILNR